MLKFTLPNLPYAYDALEPVIDKETMLIHYTKHHAAYASKFNAALENLNLPYDSAAPILKNLNSLPESVRPAIRNHGGGFVNHNLFWTIMAPPAAGGGGEPTGALAAAIADTFGSFTAFKTEFENAALTQFGSGWAWLALAPAKKLTILKTSNQDTPLSAGAAPILNLDVWEHAYYLKYQNRRPDYVSAWWHIINWRWAL